MTTKTILHNAGIIGNPFGVTIKTDPRLTVKGDAVKIPLLWKKRLMSWPWRPWVAYKIVYPEVPDPAFYNLPNGVVVCHPYMRDKLLKALDDVKKGSANQFTEWGKYDPRSGN